MIISKEVPNNTCASIRGNTRGASVIRHSWV